MMNRPQVLVLGARGMLGVAAVHQFRAMEFGVTGLARPHVDALQSPATLPLHEGLVVFNAIGLINRRLDALPDSLFWRVNGLWPRLLADECARKGAHLVHVSTDCVFDGAGAPHDETALPDAKDTYGASKAAGEPANALVIRSSIIGPELDHRYSLLCWFLGQAPGSTVQGFANHLWNGVTTLELARVAGDLIAAGAHRTPGLQHVHSEDVSKYELLCLFKQAFGSDVRVDRVEAPAARDMRLASRKPLPHPVRPLASQIADLVPLCGPGGQWKGAAA